MLQVGNHNSPSEHHAMDLKSLKVNILHQQCYYKLNVITFQYSQSCLRAQYRLWI